MAKRDPNKTYKPRDPDPTLAARRSTARAERQQPDKNYTPNLREDEGPSVVVGKTLAEQRAEQDKPPLAEEVERVTYEDDKVEFDGDTWQRTPADYAVSEKDAEALDKVAENQGLQHDAHVHEWRRWREQNQGPASSPQPEGSPEENDRQRRKREERAQRERDELVENIKESGEAKVGRKKFAPVHAAVEMQPVWRVFEKDGTPAGKELYPSDGGGFWDNNPNSDDPEKAANHLAATINDRRERAGRL